MQKKYSHIITCCNTGKFSSLFGIALLSLEKDKVDYLELSHPKIDFSKITGFTGITNDENYYYIGAQGHPSKIIILDNNLNVHDVISLSKYYDIHSMDIYRNSLYFAASSTNQIIELDLNNYSETIYWESPNSQEKLHLNVVKFFNDNMYALFHKDFDETGKQQGVVYNISKKEKLLTGLKHPHDIYFNQNENLLYVSSSAEGKVFSIGLKTKEVIEEVFLPGFYSRGFAIDGNQYISGISSKRLISRKEGKKISYFDGSFEEYMECNEFNSYLNIFNKESKNNSKVDFSHIGNEIYEIYELKKESTNIKAMKRSQLKKSKVNKWVLDKVN